MYKMICIAGLPAVGKTSVARALNNLLSPCAKHIDIDDVKRRVVDPEHLVHDIDSDAVRWQYYRATIKEVIALFRKGDERYVITEEVFHRKHLREGITRMCARNGIDAYWIHITCNENVIERRIRKSPRTGHILSTDQTLVFYRQFREIFDHFNHSDVVLSFNSESMDAATIADRIASELGLLQEMDAISV